VAVQCTCELDGHIQRVMIPDAVLIQFDLLMMSTTLLETCVEDCNKLIMKQRICASSWPLAKIILRCTVSRISKSISDCLTTDHVCSTEEGALTRHAIGILNVPTLLTTPDDSIFGASFVCNEE
jgi:hypothetical protein